ncbi:MAG: CHAP domain-containing protein [Ruminococcaceae bacterium]|nr:CHAP domain-containing protein [Oscillospiraceae bacterium]
MKKFIAGALCVSCLNLTAFAGESVALYAPNGRSIQISAEDVSIWENVGWYTVPVKTIYAPDGRSAVVAASDISAWEAVGWHNVPVTTIYAPDGRKAIVATRDVPNWEAVGWFTYPVKQFPVVGERIADTATYANDADRGQCVWYVRGRMTQKFRKDTGAIGNANDMWYNAREEAKLAPLVENIKPDLIASYKYGTSVLGKRYGHVIYIEDVDGDTVYYTEGGSGYYQKGTDGVVKTATKVGILEGLNTDGTSFGSTLIGFIDVSAY